MTRYLLILLMLSGCVTERKRAKICLTCPVKTSDSTIVTRTETIRDTLILIEPDSANQVIRFLPCPDGSAPKIESRETRQGRKTAIRSELSGLNLNVTAQVEPEQKAVQVKDKTVQVESKRVEQLPCPEHSHWKFWVAIGALTVIAGAGWVLYWIERITG